MEGWSRLERSTAALCCCGDRWGVDNRGMISVGVLCVLPDNRLGRVAEGRLLCDMGVEYRRICE